MCRSEVMHSDNHLDCSLCGHRSATFARDGRRSFLQCPRCHLVFADRDSHLDRAAEKAVYDYHENDPSDGRYRRFLDQLAEPLLSRLQPGMQGLDYGCGPGPTLSVMLEEAGMAMAVYDPYFSPDTSVLQRKYDFVTCSEVAEHFYRPARDWTRLASLLRRGSWLGVMTRLISPEESFERWYYKNDPTHVSFYSTRTMEWLAVQYALTVRHLTHNVVLFRKT